MNLKIVDSWFYEFTMLSTSHCEATTKEKARRAMALLADRRKVNFFI
jgi:hypothetical protein